ncbi:hypothetical protein PDR5_31440 [Pseudomonas sp. DR 5-09]|nr:hypothetical protein PDR5_31440 [Pseudomonas sp. DR 5-09]
MTQCAIAHAEILLSVGKLPSNTRNFAGGNPIYRRLRKSDRSKRSIHRYKTTTDNHLSPLSDLTVANGLQDQILFHLRPESIRVKFPMTQERCHEH